MNQKVLHQFSESALVGDAITDQILQIRQWLRESGFRSDIYTEHCQPEMEKEVLPASLYRKQHGEEIIIYHHAIGANAAERLLQLEIPIILIYHNITPPEFFSQSDPALSKKLAEGRQQLYSLQEQTAFALADSDYNELELKEFGYRHTGVLPIVLDPKRYDIAPDTSVLTRFEGKHKNLLFIGRIAPNKRQEDIIKLLYFYKRIYADARLILVGSARLDSYVEWLRELAFTLDLSDNVIITGHVSQAEMVAYYRIADLYVSMSEHEGFGKPLIESMYFDLPVLAYSSSAVPHTMGDAGVLFKQKHYEALAEVIDILIEDQVLRNSIVQGQQLRVQEYLESHVRERWTNYLMTMGLL
jgi:glycosyltransferase involved in cell wall biosynthesis